MDVAPVFSRTYEPAVRAELVVFFRIAVQFIQYVAQVFIAFYGERPTLAQKFSCLTEFFKIWAKNHRNTKGCSLQNIMYPFSKAAPDISYSSIPVQR